MFCLPLNLERVRVQSNRFTKVALANLCPVGVTAVYVKCYLCAPATSVLLTTCRPSLKILPLCIDRNCCMRVWATTLFLSVYPYFTHSFSFSLFHSLSFQVVLNSLYILADVICVQACHTHNDGNGNDDDYRTSSSYQQLALLMVDLSLFCYSFFL